MLFIRALIKRRWKLFLGIFLPALCLAGLLTLGYFRAKAVLQDLDASRVEAQLTTGFKNSGLYATKVDDGKPYDLPYELEIKDHVGKVTFQYADGSRNYYKAEIRMEGGNVRTTFSGGDGYKWSLDLTPAQWLYALPKLPWYVIRGSGTFNNDGSGTASATSPGAAQLAADLQRQLEIDAKFAKETQGETERRRNLAEPDPTPIPTPKFGTKENPYPVAKQTQAEIDAYLKHYIPLGSYYQTRDGEVRYYPMVPEPDPTATPEDRSPPTLEPARPGTVGFVPMMPPTLSATPAATPVEPSPKSLVTSRLPAATPTPTLDAKAYFDSGKASYDKKLYENAISDFSNAIRLDPNYTAAYNERGIAYYDQGEFDKAISDYNEEIRLDPNDADAYNNRGIAYRNQGKFDKANDDLATAKRLRAGHSGHSTVTARDGTLM